MDVKKDKEFIVRFKACPDEKHRIVVQKVTKSPSGDVISFTAKTVDYFQLVQTHTLEDILSYTSPLTNTEFFTMYHNWDNFYREGVHQDLEYARTVHKQICNSLKKFGTVSEGSGKFEQFDNKRLNKFLESKDY